MPRDFSGAQAARRPRGRRFYSSHQQPETDSRRRSRRLRELCQLLPPGLPRLRAAFLRGREGRSGRALLEKLARDFPERSIRVLFGSGSDALNDKAAKLARLVSEARNEIVVINDSDVRAEPNYLRTVVAPLADPQVGAVTCLYAPIEDSTLLEKVQTIGMVSDFYAGLMVGWQLEGREVRAGPDDCHHPRPPGAFGGYRAIANRPGDDLLVGRMIAEQGCRVELLPDYTLRTVPDYGSLADLLSKRTRWFVVMRHMRPWGHLGLLFTQGLPWCLAAIAVHPRPAVALGYLSALRCSG